jgi:membrane protease YdiL (CAAX protease family)
VLFSGRETPPWVAPLLGGLVTLLVSWGFLAAEGRPLASLGLWVNRKGLRHLLTGLLGGLLLAGLPALLLGFFGVIQWRAAEVRILATLGTGFLLAVAQAFSQEVFARGYVFQRLVVGLGRWPAQGLVALGFLGLHGFVPGASGFPRLLDLFFLILVSLILGEAWLRTRSLALPFGLHAGWTFAQTTLMGFASSGHPSPGLFLPTPNPAFPNWLTGGPAGLEASLPGLAMGLIALLLLLGGRRKGQIQDPDWDGPTRIF